LPCAAMHGHVGFSLWNRIAIFTQKYPPYITGKVINYF